MTEPAGFWAGRAAWARRVATGLPRAVRVRWPIALRAGLAIGLPMLVMVGIGRPEQAGFVGMGSLAAVYVPTAPYRFRAAAVAMIGVTIALGCGLGALVGGNLWLAALTAGLFAGVVSLVCQAAELPQPREVLILLAMLASTDIPTDEIGMVDRMGWTLVGAACAWVVTMSPIVLRSASPERRLVDAARAAVADLLEAVGGPDVAERRHAAAVAMRAAMVGVGQSGRHDDPLAWELVTLDRVLQVTLLLAFDQSPLDRSLAARVRGGPAGPGTVETDKTGTGAAGTDTDRTGRAGQPVEGASAGSELRLLQDRVEELTAGQIAPVGAAPSWGRLSRRVRAALGRHTLIAPAAARVGIGVLIAVLIGRLFGLSHAYWIALATCAVLQASTFTHVRRRMYARIGGTLVGVAVAFGVFSLHPSLIVMVLLAAAMQIFVESVIVVSYGIAMVAITVLSMLLFHLGAPELDFGSALGSRVLDTVIGAVLALVLRRFLWHRQTSTRLGAAQARVILRSADVLQLRWAGTTDIRFANTRHLLHTDLAALRALADDALTDFSEYQASGWAGSCGLTDRVVDLAYVALSWPPTDPPGKAEAGAFLMTLDNLVEATRTGEMPTAAPPVLAGHPRTEAAAAEVYRVLVRCGQHA